MSRTATVNVTSWTPDFGGGLYSQSFTLGAALPERDTQPPTLTLTPSAPSLNQRQPGWVDTNDPLTLTVSVDDNRAVNPDSATLDVNGRSGPALTRLTPPPPPGMPLTRVTYTATLPLQGVPGPLELTVTASDTSGNVGTRTITLQVVDPSVLLTPQPGPPRVLTESLFPRDGATDINVFESVRVGFSEPLSNVGRGTLFLRPRGGLPIEADYLPDPAAAAVTLRPQQNLHFDTTYELVATNALVDLTGEALTPNPEQVLNTFHTELLRLTGTFTDQVTDAKDLALLSGNRALVLDRQRGLLLVDLTDRTQPRLLKVAPFLSPNIGGNQALAVGQDFPYVDKAGTPQSAPIAVVVAWDVFGEQGVRGHLRVFDLRPDNPAAPEPIGDVILSDHTGGVPMRVLVVDKPTPTSRQYVALVEEITAGVAVVDLFQVVEATLCPQRQPATPPCPTRGPGGTLPTALVGLFGIPGGLPASPASLVPYRGDALYLDIQRGLFRLDLSNLPAIPGTPLAPVPSAYRLTVSADTPAGTDVNGQPILKDFAVVGTVTGVTLVDLGTNQLGPSVVLPRGPGGPPVTVGLTANPRQGLVFVAAAGGGVQVVDIRNPAQPALLGALPTTGPGFPNGGITQDGIYAYFTSGPGGLEIVKYDFCCIQMRAKVDNDQRYAAQRQDGVLYLRAPDATRAAADPTMPRVKLSAVMVDQSADRVPLADQRYLVEWTVRLRYKVTVGPGGGRRSHDETFTWTSGLGPLFESGRPREVDIPWDELSSPQSGSLTPFVGGGELEVEARVFRAAPRRDRDERVARLEPNTGLTQIAGSDGNFLPYTESMTPGSQTSASTGSRPLRIEGQLAHVLSDADRAQRGFKLASDLKATLVAYLRSPVGAAQEADTVRRAVTDTADPNDVGQQVIFANFFRLIAFRESSLRHFDDLTQVPRSVATNAGVPQPAVWPLLNASAKNTEGERVTDGGYGIMQLTVGHPTYPQIWDYRRNIDEGVRRLAGDILRRARRRVDTLRRNAGNPALQAVPDQLRQEVYFRYQAGAFTSGSVLGLRGGEIIVNPNPHVAALNTLERRLLDLPIRCRPRDTVDTVCPLPPDEWGSPAQ